MPTNKPSTGVPGTLRIPAGGNLVASTVEERRKVAMEALTAPCTEVILDLAGAEVHYQEARQAASKGLTVWQSSEALHHALARARAGRTHFLSSGAASGNRRPRHVHAPELAMRQSHRHSCQVHAIKASNFQNPAVFDGGGFHPEKCRYGG